MATRQSGKQLGTCVRKEVTMSDKLPAECPDCDTVMETREEVFIHMLTAIGRDDHRAGLNND